MSLTPAAPPRGADHTARLLISCPDGPGIVAAISSFLFEQGANIVANDQYSTHPEHGTFFMRAAFFLPALESKRFESERGGFESERGGFESERGGFESERGGFESERGGFESERERFEAAFGELAARFAMEWRISYAHERRRVALMASREDHCLFDLLWRQRRGELEMDIECVISNHDDSRAEVEALGVRYHHIPVTPSEKGPAEARALELLVGRVDIVILARYMQILSADFLDRVGCPVINIHHSFLPAFAGAEPYRRAYERGVKLIGATAHYATAELDAGPIIEQDVQRVGHGYTLEDLVRVGRDLERLVLARAVRSHLDDRVLVHEGRTIVF